MRITTKKIKRSFNKAGEKVSSTAGNVTSGVKKVIRGAQSIFITLDATTTKNEGAIENEDLIELGERISLLPKELKKEIFKEAYIYESWTLKEASKGNQQDFANQFNYPTWNLLHSMANGDITDRYTKYYLKPVVKNIKSFATERPLPPELHNKVNALTQACEGEDEKMVKRTFLNLCIEIYRIKNGIDESDLGEKLAVQGFVAGGPERLLSTHYDESRNSSRPRDGKRAGY